jgi:Arc/MetJ family transcription regulator
MIANLDIDQSLLNEAFKVGGKRTKKETVNQDLAEYIQRRKQKDLLKILEQINFDPKYDYKSARKNR